MKRKIYAAYGSNMHIGQMKGRCPDAYIIGTGYIEGYELEFRGVATITEQKNQQVPIVLWSISEQDEKALDRYEGVAVGLYRKETIKAKLESISEKQNAVKAIPKEVYAMVYIMKTESRSIAGPSSVYYDSIYQGYKQNNLDIRPLAVAAIKSGAKFVEYSDMERGIRF